ncbi:MAG TPA: carbonic anhydrase [Nitrospirota bacterium]
MKKGGKVTVVVITLVLSLVLSANLLWSFEKTHQAAEHQSAQPVISADETLMKLIAANQRYVSGKMTARDLPARRGELLKGQQPSAVVLSCSDSRVPPEFIFDQGLGDIFVVRVAGNVADPVALGSIEYAVEHLNVPLIIVMGHDKCGAVSATVAGGKPEGNIGSIVEKIAPAVGKAKASGKTGDELLDAAIIENVRNVTAGLTRDSAVIKRLVEEKKLKIVAAKYSLSSGKVDLL